MIFLKSAYKGSCQYPSHILAGNITAVGFEKY